MTKNEIADRLKEIEEKILDLSKDLANATATLPPPVSDLAEEINAGLNPMIHEVESLKDKLK